MRLYGQSLLCTNPLPRCGGSLSSKAFLVSVGSADWGISDKRTGVRRGGLDGELISWLTVKVKCESTRPLLVLMPF